MSHDDDDDDDDRSIDVELIVDLNNELFYV